MQNIKVIIISHGSFSKGILDSVQMLTGEQKDVVAYGLYPEQSVTDFTEQLEKELKNTPTDQEVIFLSDLFHGSPFNSAVALMKDYRFCHITGINLPLVAALMLERYSNKTAMEICESVMSETTYTIIDVNKFLEENQHEEEEDDE